MTDKDFIIVPYGDKVVAIPKEKPKAKLYGEFVGVEAGDEDKYKKAFRAMIDRAIDNIAEIEPDVPMSLEIMVSHREKVANKSFNWYEEDSEELKEIISIGYKFAAVPFEHLIDELERFNK